MYKKLRKFALNYMPVIIKTAFLHKTRFLYPFLKINPSSCIMMLTHRCNLRCIMCKQWQEPMDEELDADEWKRIIKDLKRNGIMNIHFTGGEPLLRKDLAELISFSCKNGLVVGLTTNGTLLREEVLSALIKNGLRSIAISMDGLNGEYERVRGVAESFRKVEEAAFLIGKMRKEGKIEAYINFTLMNNNIKELKKVKLFADQNELPLAICLLDKNSFLFDLEQNRTRLWISKKEDFDDLRDALTFLKSEKIKNPKSLIINFPGIDFIGAYFKNSRQKGIPCISSQDRIIIDAYGNLLGGCMSLGNFGNLKLKGLRELSKDKRYKLAKRNMFYKNCPGCSCGYLFNIMLFWPLAVKDIGKRLKYSYFSKGV